MKTLLALVLAASCVGPTLATEPVVIGEYVEARTCDVWTGPCFANGEMNLRGDQAILGWTVRKGAWNGVELKDLTIVAAIDAEGTLSTNAEGKVRTVVYIDERATEEQTQALIGLAATLAPKYVKNIIKVERRKIAYRREETQVTLQVGDTRKVGDTLQVGDTRKVGDPLQVGDTRDVGDTRKVGDKAEVQIKTERLSSHCDSICGNEAGFYPSLAKIEHLECAKTIENAYRGDALGLRWSDPNKRSAILGQFAL